jgi:two-component system sensor histidine kinase KdpD
MGHLTSRLRRSEIFERQRERRTAALYELGDSAPGGAGLGLAIDDGFVRAHGGNVRAANGQSGGAEFIISIPVEILRPEIMESLE